MTAMAPHRTIPRIHRIVRRCLVGLALACLFSAAQAEPLGIVEKIKEQGISHSEVMKTLSELTDGIGARLMGSPNLTRAYEWAQRTMHDLGASNVHLEDIGEFGLSWRQNNAWLRMATPDPMVFLAQASPWSVSSGGPKEAEGVSVSFLSDQDFTRYRGLLRGKIALLGPVREVLPATEPFTKHWSESDVLSGKAVARQRGYQARRAKQPGVADTAPSLAEKIFKFLADEGVAAVVLQSPAMPTKGGETGLIEVDDSPFGSKVWTVDTRVPFPVLVTSAEDFGRAWRLAASGAKPHFQFEVDSEVLEPHTHGYNVIGEISGTDPKLKREVVILGAHLDSWAAATGATDNGAGVAATLEALRILKATGARPRRTIRFILYSGEEQGLLGSRAYVAGHIARTKSGTRYRDGYVIPKTDLVPNEDYERVSAAYNIDDGSGKVLGIFAGGNPRLAQIFSAWLDDVKSLGVISVLDEQSYFSDGAPYQSVGIPGISFLQDELDYFTRTHHTNLDTLEHIVPADLAQVATVAAVFVLKTADDDDRLPRHVAVP